MTEGEKFRVKFSGLTWTPLVFGFLSLLFYLSLAISLLIARAASSLAPLAVSAFVPSPRPLAGARFFPTCSSGIPPLLTAVSPTRERTRIRSWETFLFGPLVSTIDSSGYREAGGVQCLRRRHTVAKITRPV